MPKFTVVLQPIVTIIEEVEAESFEEAVKKAHEMVRSFDLRHYSIRDMTNDGEFDAYNVYSPATDESEWFDNEGRPL